MNWTQWGLGMAVAVAFGLLGGLAGSGLAHLGLRWLAGLVGLGVALVLFVAWVSP